MNLKEKCLYWNPVKNGYYLVLEISNMVYGRYGDMNNPSYLDKYMNQDGTGLSFKIDSIIINNNYIRNYYLDEKELDEFVLIKELTKEEFLIINAFISSRRKYTGVIDINKDNHNAITIADLVKNKKESIEKLEDELRVLENELLASLKQESSNSSVW